MTTSRFGDMSYVKEDILSFPRGLPAFEDHHGWILTGDEDNAIRWLQSIDDGCLAVPVTTPDVILPDYNAKIPDDDLDTVDSRDSEDLLLLVIVSIPEFTPWDATANLRAPILVSLKNRKAVQVIALSEEYSIRHAVFPESAKKALQAAAAVRTEI
jgi:flagellar assembly factor FliW